MEHALDFFFPRHCLVCGKRLKKDEHFVCLHCNIHLPRTNHFSHLDDNPVRELFLAEDRIKQAASFMFHVTGENSAKIVYSMKYHGDYSTCRKMGRLMAEETIESGFYDDIDMIVPLPLTWKREKMRGYNQTYHLAKGIADVIGKNVYRSILLRKKFMDSQTKLTAIERIINVADAFLLRDAERIRGKHVLLVDDVITTGATTISAARQLLKGENTTVSILSLCYAGRE